MRGLDRPVGRVWRRLRFQRFLTALVWCWAVGLALAAVAIGVEKLGQPVPGASWLPFALAGGVGLVVAAAIALLSGPDRVEAAVALDRAFHLNERVSTALTLPESMRETPAGRALIADTLRHVEDLDIGDKFPPRLPRLAWVPLVPAVLALALMFAPEIAQRTATATPSVAEQQEREAITKSTEALGKKIASQRKEMQEQEDFAEIEKLLAQIEERARELSNSPPSRKDKALIELNKLSDALKDRQKQLGSAEQMNRQLQQLKEMASGGPAEDFAKNLARGNVEKAVEELKKLQEKLAQGELSDQEREELKTQLAEMKKELEKLANLDERRKQLEEARQNGGLSEEDYQKELAKLNEQSQNLQNLQKLAQQLGQCQQAMDQGNMQKAAEALGLGQEQLADMARQLQELEILDAALADLQDAKNGMAGDGMNQFGEALSSNLGGQGLSDDFGQNDNAMGRGRGAGDRPEAPDNTASYDTRVPQQINQGKAVFQGFGPRGAQPKGASVIDLQDTVEEVGGAAADALTNQRIPKNVQRHVQGYLDQVIGPQ